MAVGPSASDSIHVETGTESRVHGRAALLEASKGHLGAIGKGSLRTESLVEPGSATSFRYGLSLPNTHIARAGLRRVDEAILVMGAIAVDMRQKILGAVRRTTHAVGHLEVEFVLANLVRCDLAVSASRSKFWSGVVRIKERKPKDGSRCRGRPR